jgi:hypothetical protein
VAVDESQDSDLRRRAAWLLAMLAVVAVLFVVLLTFLLDSGGSSKKSNGSAPDGTLAISPSSSSAHRAATSSAARPSASSSPSGETSTGPATKDCPTDQPCALDGDYGKAIDAINAYRAENGQKPVPGTVSKAAQKCALSNGSDCSGGWAESQVPTMDGTQAVKKVASLGKLLQPMKSFGIGWAYSPSQKQYYFAVVRTD